MPQFDVAHIRQQNIDLIIIPLDHSFDHKSDADQRAAIADLQIHANAAGLAGTVVPVWQNHQGRMAFIAPRPWWPFFQSMSLGDVQRNINKTISW
ncbi:hypothetical protein [Azospirillum palustre]